MSNVVEFIMPNVYIAGRPKGNSATVSQSKPVKRYVNVGTIGHIDHGKQNLVTLATNAYYRGSYRPPSYYQQLAFQSNGKGGKKARKKLRGW